MFKKIFLKIFFTVMGVKMAFSNVQPYGSWDSKFSAKEIAEKTVKLNFLDIGKEKIYFDEIKAKEGGKTFLFEKSFDGEEKNVLGKEFSVRTRANEYGGKSFFVEEDFILFCNDEDQNIYRRFKSGKIEKITNTENVRYADLCFDKKRNLLFCVEEKHEGENVINSLICIDLKTKSKKTVKRGADFYSSITISPNSKKLAYLYWDLPNLPWDGTTLVISDIKENGELENEVKVAGGEKESIFQPLFSPDNILYFVSDRTNFWNIYKYEEEEVFPIFLKEAEFGYPQWLFSFSTYCFVEKKENYSIVCTYVENGVFHLAEIDLKDKSLKEIENLPFNYFFNLKSNLKDVVFIAASPTLEKSIVLMDGKTKKFKIIKKSKSVDEKYISAPQSLKFLSGDKNVYAFYYPPKNPEFEGPKGEKPPLLVHVHGGPTAQSFPFLKMGLQYFTSRGFAVLDVNYSGSTGFGREYRERLYGNWGVLDVKDCVAAAKFVCEKGLGSRDKVIISGGSAGGYTTLASLVFEDFFEVGTSYFGICDLEALALHTHKFESKYLERLIGPYPKDKELYFKRSPINFVENFSCPLILFQGGEDKIVPKSQAEKMYKALLKKKIPVAYVLFEKEGHGFRDAKNIEKALENELYFYSKILNFKLPKKVGEVEIKNF
jgi:dipeptidyl aminopeptidase/acylaminoacyl peptidase